MTIQAVIASLLLTVTGVSGLMAEDSRPTPATRPEPPPPAVDRGIERLDPEIREEVLAVRSQIADLEKQRIEEIRALGADATRESIRAINDKYNADIMALREELRAITEASRPELPENLREESEAVRAAHEALRASREQLRVDLANATTAEEKRAIVEAFREANKELHETIRTSRKAIRDGLRNDASGRNRPNDGE